jgi:hypothetical protein
MCVKILKMEVFLGFFGIDSDYLGRMPTIYALGLKIFWV